MKDSDLIEDVDKLLSQTDTNVSTPVDVERLALQEGFEVFPIKDLIRKYNFDSYINPFSSYIFIDENQYMNQYERARFTIAHEWCHLRLHSNFVKVGLGKERSEINEEDWVSFIGSITPQEEKSYEIQASIWAAYLLMPKGVFRYIVDTWFESFDKKQENIGIYEVADLMEKLVPEFNVSRKALSIHLKKEYPWIGEIIDAIKNGNSA